MSHTRVVSSRRLSRAKAVRCMVEALESRTMMTGVVGYAPDPMLAIGSVYDSQGQLWVSNLNGPNGPELDHMVNGAVADSIAMGSVFAARLTAGANQHLYFVDASTNEVGDLNLADPSAGPTMYTLPVPNINAAQIQLTVTGDGALWFTATAAANTPTMLVDNTLGRIDVNGGATITTLTIGLSDTSQLVAIASAGQSNVALGLWGTDDPVVQGQNQVAFAHFDGTAIVQDGPRYAVNTGDAAADANNSLTSIAVDDSGNVWFNLANIDQSTTRTQVPDRIVKGTLVNGQLQQTAYLVPGGDTGPLFVNGLTFDTNGRLWFIESNGNRAGLFDTVNQEFAIQDLPDGTTFPETIAVNRADGATDAWVTSENGPDSLVQVTIDLPAVTTFSGAATDITGAEDTALTSIPLATFTAPTASYTATVTWGDGTTSVGTIVDLGNNSYAVVVDSKTFASQGVYAGLVTISDTNGVAGTLGFTSTISDTPLTITSYNVSKLGGPVAVMSMTFTDDIDSTASWFTASVNWGDGKTTKGIVVKDPTQAGRYLVLAVHAYRSRGSYTVKTTITTSEQNVLASSVTATATVTV